MAVAKKQGREKPVKIEHRKVRGPEWGPQGEQRALLASPVYTGQAQGEEKHKKRRQKARGLSLPCVHARSLSLFSSHLLGWHAPMPQGCIFLYFLNKTEEAITLSQSFDTPRALMSITSNFCWEETQPRRIHLPNKSIKHGQDLCLVLKLFL